MAWKAVVHPVIQGQHRVQQEAEVQAQLAQPTSLAVHPLIEGVWSHHRIKPEILLMNQKHLLKNEGSSNNPEPQAAAVPLEAHKEPELALPGERVPLEQPVPPQAAQGQGQDQARQDQVALSSKRSM